MKLKTYHDEIYVQYYSMLAPSTVPGYESSWQLYVEPKFGSWEIEDIRVRDINLWLTEFDNAGAARKAFKILRQIINAAIADEAYPDDVAEPKFRAVRQPKMQAKALWNTLDGNNDLQVVTGVTQSVYVNVTVIYSAN